MADVEIEDRSVALLPGAHRVVRILDPSEGPFAGALVTRGDEVAVRVDVAALTGWEGWRFAGAEHVAGPVDVVRRLDGHDALLPWCTDRVLGLLVRRTASGSAPSSGECSTLVVSLLRGLDELGAGIDDMRAGVWWLTDGGRPTFVIGQGEDPRAGAAEIIGRLGEHCTDKALRRVLHTMEQGLVKALSQPRVSRRMLENWEQELLAIAAPRPLERETHAPEHVRDIAQVHGSADQRSAPNHASRRDSRRSLALGRRSPLHAVRAAVWSVFEVVRAKVRESAGAIRAGRTRPSTPKREDTSPSRRRRVLVFAGAAAAVVLIGGLLWPTGDAAESAGDAREGKGSAETWGATTATPIVEDRERASVATPAPQEGSRDPEGAATALLSMIAVCRADDDLVCADAVATGSAGVVEALASSAERSPTAVLVDEYGDVAVIKLGVPDEPSENDEGDTSTSPDQMLVLVRQDEKWLVRDVYGVADQPQ